MKIPHFNGAVRRKSDILAAGLVVGVAIVVLQLFYIQIIKHGDYKKEAYQEQVAKFNLPAERGKIYGREGSSVVPFVLNQPVYTAYADPQQVKHKAKLEGDFKEIAGGNLTDGYQDGLKNKKKRYVVLAQKLSLRQAQLLKAKKLAGVGFSEGDQRVYPEGKLGAQLLGYVDNDGDGKYGVEGALNQRLKGKDGSLQAVTDVRRIPLTIGQDDISIPAKNGQNVVLSIDRSIQDHAEKALREGLKKVGATKGSAIVMNPNNGHILAMANFPSYDPAKFNTVKDYSLFQNDVVSRPYEVGSVMKTLTVGAGLDTGAITKNTTYNNRGFVKVDDRTINNVEEDPINPNATITDILHYSLNTGVVFILKQLGGGEVNQQARNTLYDYFYNHYRFGRYTNVEQAGESKGILIAPTTIQGNNVRYANMAFGQGLNITMLQTAAAFSAAINGGTYYQPTVIDGTTPDGQTIKPTQPKIVKKNVLKPAVSKTLRDMIVRARQLGVLGGQDPAGYIVGGKTGTSQIIDPATGQYTDKNSIGSYLGFGGNKQPKYVIMVEVDDSKAAGYAGTTGAGPIFKDISDWTLDYLKIPPIN